MTVFVWGDERLVLMHQRAILWERRKTLIIADPHFGKDTVFRSAGIALPAGTTDDDLLRLGAAVEGAQAARLIILGDFFHASSARDEATVGSLFAWRQKYASVEILLIPGNHDKHAGMPPAELNIRAADGDCYRESPFGFSHAPKSCEGHLVFAGHLHPCISLQDSTGVRLRAACFWFQNGVALLPAFGSFTGNHPVRPGRDDEVFVVGDGEVLRVSGKSRARTNKA